MHRMTIYNSMRRGSVCLIVLASAMIVTVIGLASMYAVRVQRRSALVAIDSDEARFAAQSAVELGLQFVAADPNWRTTWSDGTWLNDKPLGNATFDLTGVDPQDHDLADSAEEPLVLTGTGFKGLARHKTQVTVVPQIRCLDALNTCVHTSGLLHIKSGRQITGFGAPVSTNGQLDNEGTVAGDAVAGSTLRTGAITGTLTCPAPPKVMPDVRVITDYISKATVIPDAATIEKVVLTPTYNPWGSPNPDGVYYLNAGNDDVTLRKLRVHGTLVIRTQSDRRVKVEESVYLENYRPDYPVLIVDGNAEIKHKSAAGTLSEASTLTNYNPPDAAYQGQTDTDQLDEYPNEIRGLIHVHGFLKLMETPRFRGVIVCGGDVEVDGMVVVTHDSRLYASPPEGYWEIRENVSPGSWKQVVD